MPETIYLFFKKYLNGFCVCFIRIFGCFVRIELINFRAWVFILFLEKLNSLPSYAHFHICTRSYALGCFWRTVAGMKQKLTPEKSRFIDERPHLFILFIFLYHACTTTNGNQWQPMTTRTQFFGEISPQIGQKQCPRWDSNPHCADFKSAASADWATRAIGTDYF